MEQGGLAAMRNFVAQTLPSLIESQLELVVARLIDLGVEDTDDLQYVEPRHLEGLLKPVPAAKLIALAKNQGLIRAVDSSNNESSVNVEDIPITEGMGTLQLDDSVNITGPREPDNQTPQSRRQSRVQRPTISHEKQVKRDMFLVLQRYGTAVLSFVESVLCRVKRGNLQLSDVNTREENMICLRKNRFWKVCETTRTFLVHGATVIDRISNEDLQGVAINLCCLLGLHGVSLLSKANFQFCYAGGSLDLAELNVCRFSKGRYTNLEQHVADLEKLSLEELRTEYNNMAQTPPAPPYNNEGWKTVKELYMELIYLLVSTRDPKWTRASAALMSRTP